MAWWLQLPGRMVCRFLHDKHPLFPSDTQLQLFYTCHA